VIRYLAPALLAGAWRACRATLVTGAVRRDVKEAVAAAVSRANGCSYCVDAHVVMLEGTKAHGAARAIAAADEGTITDPLVRRAYAWGATSRRPPAGPPPFAPAEWPEIVGTALVFHYIDRPVTVLLGDSPLPALPRAWRAGARRAAGWWFGRAIARAKPQRVEALLPAAPLPDDLRWAAARLALLAALAPHQIDGDAVAAFRAGAPDDAALVAVLAWAAFAAARRVVRRLVPAETQLVTDLPPW